MVPVSSGMWHSRLQSLCHQDSPALTTETTHLCCPALGSLSSTAAEGKLGLMEINLPTTASEEFAHLLHTARQTGESGHFLLTSPVCHLLPKKLAQDTGSHLDILTRHFAAVACEQLSRKPHPFSDIKSQYY